MAKSPTKSNSRKEVKELRVFLSENVKPWFEEKAQHSDPEAPGIPMREIRLHLDQTGVMDRIPDSSKQRMIEKYDLNQDGLLSYREFETLVICERQRLDVHKLTGYQKFVLGLVSTVVPESAVKKSLESYIEAYDCKPPPLFIILVSLLEIIIFIVYAVELKGTQYEVTAASGFPPYSPLIYNPYRRYEAWRYLTYMCIHVGYSHLIFNLVFQLLLGIPLEMVHKWWRMLIVYFLGVIAGSLAHSVTDPSSYLAGASGGCYALIGAHVAAIIMNWEEMQHKWMEGAGFKAVIRILLSAPVRLLVIFVFAAVDIGLAVYNRYASNAKENVGYSAHFGGALAGVLIGSIALKNLDKKPWEVVLWWIFLVIYLLLVAFAIFWNGLYPGFPESDWKPCCS